MGKEDNTIRLSCFCEGMRPKIITVNRDVVKLILYLSKGEPVGIPLLLEGLNNPLVGLIRPQRNTVILTFNPGSIAWRYLEKLDLSYGVNSETKQVYFKLVEKSIPKTSG